MKIANWSELYETNETRKLRHLQWVKVPNKQDGLSFRKIAKHERATEIFCAWILMLQIASKANPRGALLHNGKPLSSSDMSMMTGFPISTFSVAIPMLKDVGWIEVGSECARPPGDSPGTSGDSPGTSGDSPGTSGDSPGQIEGKGMEESIPKAGERNLATNNPTLEDCVAAGSSIGMRPEDIQSCFHHFNGQGWVRASGRPLKSLHSVLSNWKAEAESRRAEKQRKSPNAGTLTPAHFEL